MPIMGWMGRSGSENRLELLFAEDDRIIDTGFASPYLAHFLFQGVASYSSGRVRVRPGGTTGAFWGHFQERIVRLSKFYGKGRYFRATTSQFNSLGRLVPVLGVGHPGHGASRNPAPSDAARLQFSPLVCNFRLSNKMNEFLSLLFL